MKSCDSRYASYSRYCLAFNGQPRHPRPHPEPVHPEVQSLLARGHCKAARLERLEHTESANDVLPKGSRHLGVLLVSPSSVSCYIRSCTDSTVAGNISIRLIDTTPIPSQISARLLGHYILIQILSIGPHAPTVDTPQLYSRPDVRCPTDNIDTRTCDYPDLTYR